METIKEERGRCGEGEEDKKYDENEGRPFKLKKTIKECMNPATKDARLAALSANFHSIISKRWGMNSCSLSSASVFFPLQTLQMETDNTKGSEHRCESGELG